jgi:CRP-like cAMP-binding protein
MSKTTNKNIPDKNIAAPLINMLNYLHPVSAELAQYFNDHIYACNFRKGRLLLKAGENCEHIYFVKKGVLRGYAKEGSKEITTWITAENELVTSITALNLDVPALENIQALEDCDLLCMKSSDMQQLYTELPEFNTIGRKLLERYYRDAEGRAFIVRLTKAEYKYNYFLKMHGNLANRVPLKYIASYIGMTLETLSRVRKKISVSG